MFAPAIEESRPAWPNLLVRIHQPISKTASLLIDEFDQWAIATASTRFCYCYTCNSHTDRPKHHRS